jgi:hypothetical protein
MAITLRTSGENGAGGSGTTVAVNLSGIVAGDLIVAFAGNASDSTMTLSDGTSSFTGLTAQSLASKQIRGFYLLASVATGTVTYTATFAPTAVSKELHVWAFNPGSAVSLDTERHDGQAASSTAVSSGSITTTGTDEVVVAAVYQGSNAAVTVMQIGGVNAATTIAPGGNQASWDRILTGTLTGSATATLASAQTWLCSVQAFKTGGGGATTLTPGAGAAVFTGATPAATQAMANDARIVIRQA